MQAYKNKYYTLATILYGLVYLGVVTTALAEGPGPLPENCRSACTTPYGQRLGETENHIEAYSNCRNDCVIFDPHHEAGTYTGIKWQCVEYARRWLLKNKGMIYGDVDFAADIWDKIDHYTQVPGGQNIAIESIANGATGPPAVGDLLIYARELWGTGHVAVVTHVDIKNEAIWVAEQNFRNQLWKANHARNIPLIKKNNYYWIQDAHLLGWKRIRH